MTKRTKLTAKPWEPTRIDWIAHEREIQRLDRHAARPPWSWSVPYPARPKVKR